MQARFAGRIRFIAWAVVAIALVLVGRLYMVQIMQGEKFAERADRQYLAAGSRLFDRGSIFFTGKDGELVSAASLASGFVLAANPTLVTDAEGAHQKLSAIVPLEREDFMKRVSKTDDTYEELMHRVSEKEGKAIEALELPGISLYRERWRFYPGEQLAAQTIGFIGYGATDVVEGQYGLERYYQDVLDRGDTNLYVNFFAEIFAGLSAAVFEKGKGSEGDIVTALEPTVQLFLEKELAAYASAWTPRRAGAIIMNPKDGSIYAMAISPSFDLNDLSEVETAAFKNTLVEDVYELGSIMKPLTMAAGLDSGAITPQTTYNDTGCISVDRAKICNFDLKARGVVPMQEVLSQSLNTGVSFIATKMGKERFRDYMNRFGITEETGIDLPNEAQPLISNLQSPRQIEYDTASFGQGIALSPIAMARALAALANGGVMVTPHVATEIRYPSGLTKELGWSPHVEAISKESSEAVTRMLVSVVDKSLRNGTAKIPGYSVAAKTGTAQIANPGGGGYYDDRYLHSFFGYFPAYDAQFLMFFFALEPVGARYSSETWTQPFLDTTKFLINYYDIPPDRPADLP